MGKINIEINWSAKDEGETEEEVTNELHKLLNFYDVESITIYDE